MVRSENRTLSWACVVALLATACPPTRAELACPEGLRGCACQNGGCKLSTLACVEGMCADATTMAGSSGATCSSGGGAGIGGDASSGWSNEGGAEGEDACVVTECSDDYCEFLETWCSWELARDHGGCPADYPDCRSCVVHYREAAVSEPDRYCRAVFYCWHGCVVANSSLGESLVQKCIDEQCSERGCTG